MKPWVKTADLLTAIRIPLAILFPFVGHAGWQLAIVGVAAGTDYLDGWLARRYGGSRVGAVLDPIADKVFMVAAFLTVIERGLLAWWEIVGVLARDIIATIGAIGVWLLKRPVALPARAGGKAVTVCQLLTLTAFICESPLVRPLAWATAAIAVYAIWDYATRLSRGVSQPDKAE